MARGRNQKWICLDCKSEFSVQGAAPVVCCFCGSRHIGRAPSLELAESFAKKREELVAVCEELNPAYQTYVDLRRQRDALMAYWKQQRRRGYITAEEYDALDALFSGSKGHQEPEEAP